ncbi:hypothetical protein FHY12_003093 [Xanthomonas arboricola]|nr:hypothetical protein [Xanthomonas euroxanthea]
MRVRNLFVAVVISPELVVVLAVYALFINYPAVTAFIGSKLLAEADNWKYIAVVPPALVGWSVKAMSDIRNPSNNETTSYFTLGLTIRCLWLGFT